MRKKSVLFHKSSKNSNYITIIQLPEDGKIQILVIRLKILRAEICRDLLIYNLTWINFS